MFSCTFFGHRDCPDTIKTALQDMIQWLITEQNVNMFYVGHQGKFDAFVRAILREAVLKYPWIRYGVVLAYIPGKSSEYEDYTDTFVPEGLECVHPRFAISWRNDWMLENADFVVTYVTHNWGGAFRYAEKARRKGEEGAAGV